MIEGIAGQYSSPGFSQVMNAAMIRQSAQAAPTQRQKVTQEFMAIFYRELLKQSFKSPNLTGTDDPNSIGNAFTKDLFVEQMAQELAKSRSFSASQLFPGAIERKLVTE